MSKLTIRIEAPTITIEIDDIEALPQMLLDRLTGLADTKISAATDLPSLARELHQKAAEMRRPGAGTASALAPTPASTPHGEDLPYGSIIDLLERNPSNATVIDNLIKPLLRKGLRVKGEPKRMIFDAVNTARSWTPELQSRVRVHLLSRQRTNFPTTQQIWDALDDVMKGEASAPRETVSEPTEVAA